MNTQKIKGTKLAKDTNRKFALCVLDLDGFKHINDNMGHDAGDELLIKLAKDFSICKKKNHWVKQVGSPVLPNIL